MPWDCEMGCCRNVQILSPAKSRTPSVITINGKIYKGTRGVLESGEFVGSASAIARKIRDKACLRTPAEEMRRRAQKKRQETHAERYRYVVPSELFRKLLRLPGNGTGNVTLDRFTRNA